MIDPAAICRYVVCKRTLLQRENAFTQIDSASTSHRRIVGEIAVRNCCARPSQLKYPIEPTVVLEGASGKSRVGCASHTERTRDETSICIVGKNAVGQRRTGIVDPHSGGTLVSSGSAVL